MFEYGARIRGKITVRKLLKIGACIVFVAVCIRLYVLPPCILGFIPLRSYVKFDGDARIPADITIVTAYFNLGRFNKGENGNVFGPTLYLEWASVFEYLDNPLVLYTDSDQFIQFFKEMRKRRLNTTKIIKVKRSELWAFSYLDKIRDIYSDPNYPKFHPNTVVPEYSCVQNAKYSCLEKALASDFFRTKFFMWLDVGYFRMLTSRKKDFRLVLPYEFDARKVALNQVSLGYTMEETPEEIFKQMYVWVGGGLCLAEKQVFRNFIKDYRKALDHYIDMKLSNTDQQILFAMNTKSERQLLNLSVDVQAYKWHLWGSCWYYLGYQCYRELGPNSK